MLQVSIDTVVCMSFNPVAAGNVFQGAWKCYLKGAHKAIYLRIS